MMLKPEDIKAVVGDLRETMSVSGLNEDEALKLLTIIELRRHTVVLDEIVARVDRITGAFQGGFRGKS